MRILAIDPGTEKSGWIVFDTDNYSVEEMGITDNFELLDTIETLNSDLVAFEMIASYGMPIGKTTIETIFWIGRLYQKCESLGIPTERLYKKIDINPTICGSNKAKDSNIRRALLDMFPANGGGKTPQVGTKSKPGVLYGVKEHIWAALAIAMTYSIKNKKIKRVY